MSFKYLLISGGKTSGEPPWFLFRGTSREQPIWNNEARMELASTLHLARRAMPKVRGARPSGEIPKPGDPPAPVENEHLKFANAIRARTEQRRAEWRARHGEDTKSVVARIKRKA
jgi:hypothetical protein